MEAVVLAGIPFVALGLGRFGYGLLLPDMRDALGWSYLASGVVATANSLGYLIGAGCAAEAIKRIGLGPAVLRSMWATVCTILLMSHDGGLAWAILVRFGAGFFGGVAFVGGGVMAATARERGVRHALTTYPAGAGAGIAVSIVGIRLAPGQAGWSGSWLVLGVLASLAALAVAPVIRESSEPPPTGSTAVERMAPTVAAAYAMYGLGYITFATFALAYLGDAGTGAAQIDQFWLTTGIAGVGAAAIWPKLLDRLPGGLPLAAPMLAVACSIALILGDHPALTLVSAALFGSAFLTAISGATTMVRRDLPASAWAGAIGALTTWFAVGQSAGPIIAGLVGDHRPGLRLALAGSVVVLVAGAALAAGSPPPARRAPAGAESSGVAPHR